MNLQGIQSPLYQPIERPDFSGSEVKQPCAERLSMMLAYLGDRKPGNLVDLGCHTGWFCRAFARLGWDAIGIDRSTEWIYTAKVLNAMCEGAVVPPSYVNADLEFSPVPRSDVALCLSVAMYLFQNGEGWRFLDKVSRAAPVMFLDFGGMYAKYLPFTEATAIESILHETAFTRGTLLGHTAFEGRPFFVFER